MARNGTSAATEFRKLLDHPGIVTNFVTGALANLQIGRAYGMAGDTTKAKAAYNDFLTLWKDADPDIPLLKQAKAEYAKLQQRVANLLEQIGLCLLVSGTKRISASRVAA